MCWRRMGLPPSSADWTACRLKYHPPQSALPLPRDAVHRPQPGECACPQAVVESAVATLVNMMMYEDPATDVKQAFVAARGIEVLCSVAPAHSGCEFIVRRVSMLLYAVSANDQRCKSQCIAHGAPATLAAALSAFGGNDEVVSNALGAVRNICAGDTEAGHERKSACVGAGLLPLVVKSVRTHLRDTEIAELGCSALVNLVCAEAHEAAAASAGGHKALLTTVVAAMRMAAAEDSAMALMIGGSAISLYTMRGGKVDKGLALTAARVGAVDVLTILLNRVPGVADMDTSIAAGPLCNLLIADPGGAEMRAAFRKAGVLTATLKVLKREPGHEVARELYVRYVQGAAADDAAREALSNEHCDALKAAGFPPSELACAV